MWLVIIVLTNMSRDIKENFDASTYEDLSKLEFLTNIVSTQMFEDQIDLNIWIYDLLVVDVYTN